MKLTPGTRRLATPGFELNLLATSRLTTVPLALVIGVVVGVILVAKPIVILGVIALALAGIGLRIAFIRPDIAFGGMVAILALIPTYAAPKAGPVLLLPIAAAGWMVGLVLIWRNYVTKGWAFRINYVDHLALLFFFLMLISTAFSPQASFHDWVQSMFLWIGPWLGARVLLPEVESPVKVLALSFALVTAVLAPIAAIEAIGGSNPFYNLNFNSGEFGIWASQIGRFGSVRAVTSFGHPIAFSMFLACSALLSIAMGIGTENPRARGGWYVAAALAVGTMALAISRTGWVMLAIGIVFVAVITVRGPIRRRLTKLFGIVLLAVLLVAVLAPSELSVLPGVGHQESNFATSGQYREALLDRALQPGVLHIWGNATNQVTPAVSLGSATDNAYIILADQYGLIPTFALIALAAGLIIGAIRAAGVSEEPFAIVPIVAFTCLVAIFFVAFITQQQAMIWFLIGAAGAAVAHATELSRDARLAARERARGPVVGVLAAARGDHRRD
jgi:hypothetical protein